ncbi:hypothetical protein [uncultured Gemmiger sp.]|uniref:hypothetical protein n=1 Tax=uncultured Gemmiger sp. TaxID=1623490 RepID=UPI0025DDD3DA|nr:hypothetical protein [uncultured Gemmiger sp.]
MVKKIIAVATTILMLCCMVPLSAFADTHTHTFGDNKRGIDMSSLPDDYYCPVTFYETPCSELCGYSKYEWSFGARSESFVDVTGLNPLQVYAHWHTWFEKAYGAGANLKQYETGGGSAGTGGVGRRPSGYADDSGTPSISSSGAVNLVANHWYTKSNGQGYSNQMPVCIHSGTEKLDGPYFSSTFSCSDSISSVSSTSKGSYISGAYFYFKITFPCNGRFSIVPVTYSASSCRQVQLFNVDSSGSSSRYVDFSSGSNVTDTVTGGSTYYYRFGIECSNTSSFSATVHNLIFNFYPTSTTVSKDTSITINQNVWNGNIYQDNSTNLTYIYPQYTTINENNETVTNISENPIIYDSTTNQYYTYDSVTNNYYYITYVTETPTPTPSPDPGTDPTPTPEPGGDTGDTTGILAVLVEIRDNMAQGFADLKATLVQGWADLSANFTLAIENLNLNITNIFNKKFPDQSTPETAQPSPSPSPSPDTSPSPTPDPDNPDATPTPTPAPTDKPSGGNTNNFWNFVFPGGNDDGTENGHKGILWALISLLIAVVTFVLGLGSAYSYVFPFLPAGLVTTIHICVLVLLLFAIIKFVRSFL